VFDALEAQAPWNGCLCEHFSLQAPTLCSI